MVREAIIQELGQTAPLSVKGPIVNLQQERGAATLERKLSGIGQLVG